MTSQSLEMEFSKYWSRLTLVEKESLLTVAKNYIQLKGTNDIDAEEYDKDIDEAVKRVEAGEFYSHEEVLKMAKDW